METWYVVQVKCPGTNGDERHDDLPCEGGEWRDEFSFENARGGPKAILAIFRSDRKAEDVQLIRMTREVLDM